MAPGTLGNASVQVALSKHYEGAKGLMNIALLPRFLLRQGSPFLGQTDFESNFGQLLEKDKRSNPKFAKWLDKGRKKYTGHCIQDEIIEIIAMKILRKITKQIQSSNFYSILADETSDVANIEQLSFVIRIVTQKIDVKEYLRLLLLLN